MIRYVLTDIEGTTTSIDFVHEILFPYSARNLESFIEKHKNELRVKDCLKKVSNTLIEEGNSNPTEDDNISALLKWIKEDRKHPGLKALQGMLWKDGYEQGAYKAHVYADVPPCLERWTQSSISAGIYSSGSVEAQKLLFAHTSYGDLNKYFSNYYDTAIGHKREVSSYKNIQQDLGLPASDILFLSDIEEELDAAKEAGYKTCQLVRESTEPTKKHKTSKDFFDIDLRSFS